MIKIVINYCVCLKPKGNIWYTFLWMRDHFIIYIWMDGKLRNLTLNDVYYKTFCSSVSLLCLLPDVTFFPGWYLILRKFPEAFSWKHTTYLSLGPPLSNSWKESWLNSWEFLRLVPHVAILGNWLGDPLLITVQAELRGWWTWTRSNPCSTTWEIQCTDLMAFADLTHLALDKSFSIITPFISV